MFSNTLYEQIDQFRHQLGSGLGAAGLGPLTTPSRTLMAEPCSAGAREARPEPRAKPAELGKNNVFADRDGNVYRRTNQGWEQSCHKLDGSAIWA